MALSIGVKAGSKIKFGHSLLTVLSVDDGKRIEIEVQGAHPSDRRYYMITEEQRTEIAQDVYVFCGADSKRWSEKEFSRIAFEAPRAIRINRV